MKKKGSNSKNYLGAYQVPCGRDLVGELNVAGENTILRVHADHPIQTEEIKNVKGVAYSNDYITLVDCICSNQVTSLLKNDMQRYQAEIFPHYVVMGSFHFEPDEPYIKAIHFVPTDVQDLFPDYDAFGLMMDARPLIDSVLAERRKIRPVQDGENPLIMYYTGKGCVVEAPTSIGKISVRHWPSFSSGTPAGVFINSEMKVSLEPNELATFPEMLRRMHIMGVFLSMNAGRAQGIKDIQLEIAKPGCENTQLLSVFPSYALKVGGKGKYYKPHPADIPLNAVRSPENFKSVLAAWVDCHPSRHTARARYLGCLRQGNDYDFDRLVAAANMFDILPADAVPEASPLDPELAEAKQACRSIFKKLPKSVDRNSVLNALGRVGKPSLPKKIAHRAAMVVGLFGEKVRDLEFVAGIAVKLRNYYVHGSLEGLDYDRIEPFLAFLTDTLEFIFAASDLLDAGWDGCDWSSRLHGSGHSFSRYLHGFDQETRALRIATMPHSSVDN